MVSIDFPFFLIRRCNSAENDRDHPYFVALQAHPEFCSRPLNPSPPFLGLIAAACGGSVLAEQLALSEKEYTAPHPESAKVIPASEAVTDLAKGRKQAIDGIRVRGEVKEEESLETSGKMMGKVHLKENLSNGSANGLSEHLP